jgi:hypothetical protein
MFNFAFIAGPDESPAMRALTFFALAFQLCARCGPRRARTALNWIAFLRYDE